MKEYIERAQLLKNLGYDETRRADVLPGSTFDIVLKEPAADVAEVRHGRWEFSDLIFDDPKEYFINENGEIKSVNGEEVTCKEVCCIVNNHDYITRCDELLFTDQERNLMKLFQDACVDTVYIKREKYGGLSWYSSNSTNLENHLLPFRLFKTLPNNTTICVKDYI